MFNLVFENVGMIYPFSKWADVPSFFFDDGRSSFFLLSRLMWSFDCQYHMMHLSRVEQRASTATGIAKPARERTTQARAVSIQWSEKILFIIVALKLVR